MKITDPDVIKNGEKDLIDAVKEDLDLDAVKQILQDQIAQSALSAKGGQIVVHNNQIAFRLDFDLNLSGSLMFDRSGNYIALAEAPEKKAASENLMSEDVDLDDVSIDDVMGGAAPVPDEDLLSPIDLSEEEIPSKDLSGEDLSPEDLSPEDLSPEDLSIDEPLQDLDLDADDDDEDLLTLDENEIIDENPDEASMDEDDMDLDLPGDGGGLDDIDSFVDEEPMGATALDDDLLDQSPLDQNPLDDDPLDDDPLDSGLLDDEPLLENSEGDNAVQTDENADGSSTDDMDDILQDSRDFWEKN